MTPKALILAFFLMVSSLFLYDGARMLVAQRELQHALNTAVMSAVTSSVNPASLRTGNAPEINEAAVQDNVQYIFNRSMKFKTTGPVTVKVYRLNTEPPAVVASAETVVKSTMASFLSGQDKLKPIRARTSAVYEAKNL